MEAKFSQDTLIDGKLTTVDGVVVDRPSTAVDIDGFSMRHNSSIRWLIGKNGLETGSNVGSDLLVSRFDDAGGFLGNAIYINRANGNVTFSSYARGISPVGSTDFVTKGFFDARTTTINGTAGRTTVTGGTQDFSANRTWTIDLAASGVAAGTYSGLTIDIYGRITSATTTGLTASGLTTGKIPKAASANTLVDSILTETSGVVTSSGNIAAPRFVSNDAPSAVNITGLSMANGSSGRWVIGKLGLETGSNAGSDLYFTRLDDSAGFLGNALIINRATGVATFSTVTRGVTPVGSTDFVIKSYFDARTLTINGTAGRTTVTGGTQDLSANRTWTVDLAASGVSAGTYAGLTIDIYGRITSATSTGLTASGLTTGKIPKAASANTLVDSILTETSGVVTSSGNFAANRFLSVESPSAVNISGLSLANGSSGRWVIGKLGLESGSNAGSDLYFTRLNDSAGFLGNPLTISRATGIVTFEQVAIGVTPTASNHLTTKGYVDGSFVLLGRTLTINGSSQDLSANRTWNVGTVTSVGLLVPTGFDVLSSPVTGAGNVQFGFTSGYSLPTNSSQNNWNTAYGWGNHASAGYVPGSRTLTINGVTYDLTANRSWTISSGLSGSGTSGQIAVWNGSGSLTGSSNFVDAGSEYTVNKSFAVTANSAIRADLNVWQQLNVGTSSYHGGIRVHNDAGSAIDGSAAIEIVSTTRALKVSIMSTTQRDAMSLPGLVGYIIYNASTGKFQGRVIGSWVDFH